MNQCKVFSYPGDGYVCFQIDRQYQKADIEKKSIAQPD